MTVEIGLITGSESSNGVIVRYFIDVTSINNEDSDIQIRYNEKGCKCTFTASMVDVLYVIVKEPVEVA